MPEPSLILKMSILGVELPAMTAMEPQAEIMKDSGRAKPDGMYPDRQTGKDAVEIGGPKGPEPTRYGDWEKNGRCIDF